VGSLDAEARSAFGGKGSDMAIENRVGNYYRWKPFLLVLGGLALGISLVDAQQFGQAAANNEGAIKGGNTISLRNVLRITRTSDLICRSTGVAETRQHIIEFELHSRRPFIGGKVYYALYIGKRRFTRQSATALTVYSVVFELTPEEFARTKPGDEVTVVGYRSAKANKYKGAHRTWKFDGLDKRRINHTPITAVFNTFQGPLQILTRDGKPVEDNKMRIRRVLYGAESSRRPVIQIDLCSIRSLNEGNSGFHLQIGSRGFGNCRYGDTSGHEVFCTITPEEFAQMKDGDEVILTGGQSGISAFGKLDKGKLEQ
jgi:hypothetical protein